MQVLPNLEHAVIPVEKLRDYALNMEHAEGRLIRRRFSRRFLESNVGTQMYWLNCSGQRCQLRLPSRERATNMATIGPPTIESSGLTVNQPLSQSAGYSKKSRVKRPN